MKREESQFCKLPHLSLFPVWPLQDGPHWVGISQIRFKSRRISKQRRVWSGKWLSSLYPLTLLMTWSYQTSCWHEKHSQHTFKSPRDSQCAEVSWENLINFIQEKKMIHCYFYGKFKHTVSQPCFSSLIQTTKCIIKYSNERIILPWKCIILFETFYSSNDECIITSVSV